MFRPTMAREEKPLPAETITQTGPVCESPLGRHKPNEVALRERDNKRYEFVGEHARGGLGRVMRTRDLDLGREVAIKEILEPGGLGEARFVREAMITARLEHPGIVPVHDAGKWPDGTPFYAMKLVAGRPLKAFIHEAKTVGERLRLLPHVLAVTDAIAYAHSRGIIHRDLKPSNIIIGDFGEAVVIDWGLAKDLRTMERAPEGVGPYRNSTNDNVTVAGAVLGTPAYMPPEQASGEDVDERADVYSIGALMYHLLAGVPPYAGSNSDILASLVRGTLIPLTTRSPELSPDLVAIVAKAMSRSPQDRYENGAALAADLRRYLDGRLVTAYQYSVWSLVRKWAQKHIAAVAIGATSLCALGVVSVLAVRRVVAERDRAVVAEDKATNERDRVYLNRASDLLATDPTMAVAWLKRIPESSSLAAQVARVARDAQSRGVAVHDVPISTPTALIRVRSNPTGTRLVVSDMRGTVRILDASSLREMARFEAAPPAPILVSDDGSLVVTADNAGNTIGWHANATISVVRAHSGVPYVGVFLTATSTVTAGLSGDVVLTDWRLNRARVLVKHAKSVRAIDAARDGKIVATGSDAGDIVLTSLPSGSTRVLKPPTPAPVYDVDFLADGRLLSTQGDGSVVLWSVDGRMESSQRFPVVDADHARASTDGKTLVLFGQEGSATLLDVPTLQGHALLPSSSPMTSTILLSTARGPLIGVSHEDGALTYFYLEAGLGGRLLGHPDGIADALALATKDGANFIAVDPRGELHSWMIADPVATSLHKHDSAILTMTWSPKGGRLASAGYDHSILISTRSEPTIVLEGHADMVSHLAFSTDGTLLASSSWDRTVKVWNAETGNLIRSIQFDGVPTSAKFHDGNTLYAVEGPRIHAISLTTGERTIVADSPEDIRFIQHDEDESFVVLTSSGQLLKLSRTGAPAEIICKNVLSVYNDGSYLFAPPIASSGSDRLGYRRRLGSDRVEGILLISSDFAWSTYNPKSDTYFVFTRHGVERWHAGASQKLSTSDLTAGAVELDDGRLMMLTSTGVLESLDFNTGQVLMDRPLGEVQVSRSVYAPEQRTIFAASRAGDIWAISLEGANAAWSRQRQMRLSDITDYLLPNNTGSL